MDDTEDRVGSHEVPRVNGRAAFGRIARKPLRIDGVDSAAAAWSAAVQLRFVDIDPFLVLGGRPGRGYARGARACRHAVAGRLRRRIQRSVIGYVVKHTRRAGWPATDDRRKAGKGVRWLRGAGVQVVDSRLSQCGQVGAIGSSV